MTKLLISVTNVEEAKMALDNGADIIDLKDPAAGALGALPLEQIQSVVAFINHRKLVSATIGDLPMEPELVFNSVNQLIHEKIDYIKIGFFEAENFQPTLSALKSLTAGGAKLIAVLFAEIQYPKTFISAIKHAGFIGVMLDTAKKNGLTLFDHYSALERNAFAQQVLSHGLSLGLAGSLNVTHITLTKALNPTYIGFRGGVCDQNQRELTLSADKISEICKLL